MKKRNRKIDVLRFIAIIAIIIAHAGPPNFVFQIRNFDVTLMVLLLGASFYLSNNQSIFYKKYIFKRVERLLFPTWIFLTIFFVFFSIINKLSGVENYFSFKTILMSYSLMNGIGYVWIMKVFLIIAIIIPFILQLSKKITNNFIYFISILLGFGFYYYLLIILSTLSGTTHVLFLNFIIHGFGYGLIAAIGLRIHLLKQNELLVWGMFFLITFIILMISSDFSSIQNYKTPPSIYYLSYGLFISFSLYRLLDISFIKKLFNNKYVYFISNNSLNLYYWHIFPIFFLKIYRMNFLVFDYNFITRFIFIFGFAYIMTSIQNKISLTIYKNKVVPE